MPIADRTRSTFSYVLHQPFGLHFYVENIILRLLSKYPNRRKRRILSKFCANNFWCQGRLHNLPENMSVDAQKNSRLAILASLQLDDRFTV